MTEEEERKAEAAEEGKEGAASAESVISEQDMESLVRKTRAGETSPQGTETPSPVRLDELGTGKTPTAAGSIDMLMDVTLNVRIELGRTHMSVEDILALQGESVVTLDKLAGDFVDVLVNDKLVARGEVLILNDHFCVRIAEIVSPEERQDASLG